MNIVCDKTLLSAAIDGVSKAVTMRSSIPVLEGILLKAEGFQLTLTGYDLEMGIVTTIEANIKEPGEIVLNAKLLSSMISRMPAGQVSILSAENGKTTIQSGVVQFEIQSMPANDFPELPNTGAEETLTIKTGVLKDMIDRTLYAVSQDDKKPAHTGELFEIELDKLTMVALDGYRLAIRKEKIDFDGSLKFVVPEKTLSEISKLIGDGEEKVKISVEKRHIIFEIGGCIVISRLLEGEFMDWESAVPKACTSTVLADTHELRSCIDRVSLVVNDRDRVFVRCFFEEKEFKAMCESTVGNAVDKVGISLEGDRVEIGFNSRYLIDALRAVEDDRIKIELNGAFLPIKIMPTEGDNFLFIVLPVRITKG